MQGFDTDASRLDEPGKLDDSIQSLDTNLIAGGDRVGSQSGSHSRCDDAIIDRPSGRLLLVHGDLPLRISHTLLCANPAGNTRQTRCGGRTDDAASAACTNSGISLRPGCAHGALVYFVCLPITHT